MSEKRGTSLITMEQALAVLDPKDGEAMVPGTPWTRNQAATLVRTVAPGLTTDEFKLFAARCQFSGLDPFMGQIHAVKRKSKDEEKLCIQTGIDGYRLIAHRTGECAGIDDCNFSYRGEEGEESQPTKASCTVYRMVQGQRVPFTSTVRWNEYYPGERMGFMWKNKPHVMLGKCAEASALRKAFPAELAHVYVEEELQQSEPRTPVSMPKVTVDTSGMGKAAKAACAEIDAAEAELLGEAEQKDPDADPDLDCREIIAELPIDVQSGMLATLESLKTSEDLEAFRKLLNGELDKALADDMQQ